MQQTSALFQNEWILNSKENEETKKQIQESIDVSRKRLNNSATE